MAIKAGSLPLARRGSGWMVVGLLALAYTALYILNLRTPLLVSSYSTRIWNWSELALFITALVVIAFRWRLISLKFVVIGAILGLLSGLSYSIRDYSSVLASATEGVSVWLTFMAGSALFAGLPERSRIASFQPPLAAIFRSVSMGLLFAIPLAAVNNLFFYLQNGAPAFQNIFSSAFEALSPGIHEEAVFRYFILAICFSALKDTRRPQLAFAVSIALAVVPHSLNHLPDLFLDNPLMGIFMLAATSLLFGLPMALLQVKRSFETAVAFHWFIDFVRFWFGY